MKKALFACILFVVAVAFSITGCVKNGASLSSSSECTIKGKIIRDCSGTPLASYPLSIYQKSNLLGSSGGVRGTGSTDADGSFSIHLKDLNDMDIEVEHESSDPANHGPALLFTLLPSSIKSHGSSATTDLGTVYLQSTINVLVKFHLDHTFGPNDTLYVGDDALSAQKVYPVTEGALAAYSVQGGGALEMNGIDPGTGTKDLYWGIGAADFDRSYHYYQYTPGTPRHQIKAKAGICVQADTTVVSIQ